MLKTLRSSAPAVALALCAHLLLAPSAQARRPAKIEARLVELFTAQGCAGCPDADSALNALADRKDVVLVTFPVDYWDYLGWKDTLARPEFTARQNAYKARFKLREIYTPQVVVQGRSEAAGGDKAKVEALIQDEAPARPSILRVRLKGARVAVSGYVPEGASAEVWLVRFDPAKRTVKVKSGENRGKTVEERNVARELKSLGRFKSGHKVFSLPEAGEKGLSTLIIVQGAKGGPVLALAH